MGIVECVMTVDAVDAKYIDQIGERVAFQLRQQMAGERERVARLDAFRREAKIELLFHAYISRCVKRDNRIESVCIATKNGEMSVEANKVYEVSILDGYLVSQSWEVS